MSDPLSANSLRSPRKVVCAFMHVTTIRGELLLTYDFPCSSQAARQSLWSQCNFMGHYPSICNVCLTLRSHKYLKILEYYIDRDREKERELLCSGSWTPFQVHRASQLLMEATLNFNRQLTFICFEWIAFKQLFFKYIVLTFPLLALQFMFPKAQVAP